MPEQAEEYRDEEGALETARPPGEGQGPAGSQTSPAGQAVRQQERDLETGAENPGE